MFTWAIIEDLRARIIQDRIWLILFILALPAYIYWLTQIATPEEKIISIINILFTLIFSFLFLFGGMGFGDIKALIVLSFTTPVTHSTIRIPVIGFDLILSFLAILFFFFLYLILYSWLLLIRNIVEITKYGALFKETQGSILTKFNALLSSRRVSITKLENLKHSDPIEFLINDQWTLLTPLYQPIEEDEIAIAKEKEARKQALIDATSTNRDYLWYRPQPPGLVFITISYISWILFSSPVTPFS